MKADNEKNNNHSVAVLSDIHGNLPALEACLRDARTLGADSVWCLGDCLEGGLFVNKIVDRLRHVSARILIGNGDQKVLRLFDKQNKCKETYISSKYQVLEQANKKLGPSQRLFLESLPTRIWMKFQGFRLWLAHGSPFGVSDRIEPGTPNARFKRLAKDSNADLIVCGHTHQSLYRQIGGTLFMNPGSVGCPPGDTCRAAYALLRFISGSVWMESRQVEYTIPKAMRNAFRIMWDNHKGPDFPSVSRATSIAEVLRFARNLGYEEGHAIQVRTLALDLFDSLTPLHAFGPEQRFLLESAALLHDIGVLHGPQQHHKSSMNLILSDRQLPFNPKQRIMIALIARYHRKALPDPRHSIYRGLTKEETRQIWVLGGILRMADGLDRSHESRIRGFRLVIGSNELRLFLTAKGNCQEELQYGQIKSDLLQSAVKFKIRMTASKRSSDPIKLIRFLMLPLVPSRG